MKKITAILLLLALVLALSACGGSQPETVSDLEYVQGNGKMIIGYTVYAPMNYTDQAGNFVGFDTELSMLVCEKLGVEPEFLEINWETKEVELNAKSIDCIWNGLTITPERQETMEITIPYVKNAQVVLMKAGADYTEIGRASCRERV